MTSESSRPLLLPSNRKLRHLRGLSLRNLTFSRLRGRTIDDAAINKSPEKLEALREPPQLHHALSTESLRPRPRRRSTAVASESPLIRQRRLELSIDSRAADAFFSLHVRGAEEPIYISEVGERATNFNFRFFDLSELSASVTRSTEITVRVWVQRQETWRQLLEEEVNLKSLNFLDTLRGLHFPPNCLIFHLIDGMYSVELSSAVRPPKKFPSLPTSSYNALMRLATLDSSIQDALATKEALVQQINALLTERPVDKVPEAEDKMALAQKYVHQQRRAVKSAQKRRDELVASIATRRAAIRSGQELQDKAAADVAHAMPNLAESKALLAQTRESIHGQRRRICSDLMDVFPIMQVPLGPPLSFQICGLPLPNTAYDQALLPNGPGSEDALSAALGLVAQLARMLQFYLAVPLPYELRPFGSRSSVRDDISLLPDAQREFPLHLPGRGSGAAQFRFDYGWFLLNKDVEALCAALGLRVVDIRHTLPNLKYLMYVASAGSDDVPARKRGGVRGLLWAGRRGLMAARSGGGEGDGDGESSSVLGSRRGSTESETAAKQRDELRRAIRENGGAGAAQDGDDASSLGLPSPIGLPFDESEMKISLRTKGLRENVVK